MPMGRQQAFFVNDISLYHPLFLSRQMPPTCSGADPSARLKNPEGENARLHRAVEDITRSFTNSTGECPEPDLPTSARSFLWKRDQYSDDRRLGQGVFSVRASFVRSSSRPGHEQSQTALQDCYAERIAAKVSGLTGSGLRRGMILGDNRRRPRRRLASFGR